jgi:hypothetical protein
MTLVLPASYSTCCSIVCISAFSISASALAGMKKEACSKYISHHLGTYNYATVGGVLCRLTSLGPTSVMTSKAALNDLPVDSMSTTE